MNNKYKFRNNFEDYIQVFINIISIKMIHRDNADSKI